MMKSLCTVALALGAVRAANSNQAAVAGCTRCSSASTCLATLDRALTEASAMDRLAVLEEVFAGDTCEELGDDNCLVMLETMLASLPAPQRLATLATACTAGVLDTHLGVADAAADVLAADVSEDGFDAAIAGKVASVAADADNAAVDTGAGAAVASPSSATATLPATVAFDIERPPLAATTMMVLGGAEFGAGGNAIPESNTAAAAAADACSRADDTTLRTSLQTLTDATRLQLLEEAYPGDICEQLDDAACLATLERLAQSASHTEWREYAERACIESGAVAPAGVPEAERMDIAEGAADESTSGSVTASPTATCGVCDDATDKICLATLDAAYDSMDDKARLKFERATLDADNTKCSGLKDIACLEVLDAIANAFTDKERLATWRDACAAGYLDTESSFTSMRSKSSSPASTAELAAVTTELSIAPVASANTDSSVASCAACAASASDTECLATLERALDILSDRERLQLERATFLSGPDDRAQQQASAGVNVPVLHNEGSTTNLAVGAMSSGTSAGAARLCDGLSDRDCLATLDLKLALLNSKQRLGVLSAACDRGILGTADDRVAIAALALQLDSTSSPDEDAGDASAESVLLPEGTQTAGGADSASAPESAPTSGGLPQTPAQSSGTTDVSSSSSDTQNEFQPETVQQQALSSRETCSLCDGLADDACLDILDAKVVSMDDLNRLGFEKRILGAGICDQTSIGDKVCLAFLDKKIASMSNKERLATWELACAYEMFGPSEPPKNTTAFSGGAVKPDFTAKNTTALKKSVSPKEATMSARAELASSTSREVVQSPEATAAPLAALAIVAVAVGAVVARISQRRDCHDYVPLPAKLPI